MAEYIAREALLELINEDCKYKNPTNEYTRGCNEVCDWAIKTIKNIPTADVVPKSEVERLEQDNEDLRNILADTLKKYRNCEAEVAREIFEEINTIKKEYASGDIDGNELYVRLYMLEKKYTEEKE